MSELLFEGYGIPAISYANDSLAALNLYDRKDALVISSSAYSTTITPVLSGIARLDCTKRSADVQCLCI